MNRQRLTFFAILLLFVNLSGCTGLLFQPMKSLVRTPDDINLRYQDIQFVSRDDTNLHGWFLPAEGTAKGTVLLLHGNAQNISTHIGSVHWLPSQGFNVFLFDYRGYGNSEGTAYLQGAFLDIDAALQWLINNPEIDPTRIVVLGQSLGGAMGTYTLTQTEHGKAIRALVLDSVFSDYRQIVREKFSEMWLTWPLQYPLSWLFNGDYSPMDFISKVSPTPVLIIQGKYDIVVPSHHAQQLYDHALQPKDIWLIAENGHISALAYPEVQTKLVNYLIKILDQDQLGINHR